MALELFAIGQYKGATILLKRGNCLKEFPYYFTDEFAKPSICSFSIYSSIGVNLSVDEGLAAEIMKLPDCNLPEKIAERGTKRPKAGELLFVPQDLTHWSNVIFVVLHELENPTDDDRLDFIEYIKTGFDLAEEKAVDAVVTPGMPMAFKLFDGEVAAGIILEAIEMFLEMRNTEWVRIISLCVESTEEVHCFVNVARERFQKFSTWLFLKE
jgi:O-acetyl-ADP-ribose deacetylase (regulator of RNase III)